MLNHESSAKFRGGLDVRGPEGRKGPKMSKKTKIRNPRFIFIFEGGVGVPFFYLLHDFVMRNLLLESKSCLFP